jgi:hypothetical protein
MGKLNMLGNDNNKLICISEENMSRLIRELLSRIQYKIILVLVTYLQT